MDNNPIQHLDDSIINVIKRGINILNKPLFPLNEHSKDEIFERDLLNNYITSVLINENSKKEFQIEGDSFEEVVSNFATLFCGDDSEEFLHSYLIPCVEAEFKCRNKNLSNFMFSQIRKTANLMTFVLPNLRKKLRNFLTIEFKNQIDSIQNYTQAQNFIKSFGSFYIRRCTLGALNTLTSCSDKNKFKSAADLTKSIIDDFNYDISNNSKENLKINLFKRKKESDLTYEFYSLGGKLHVYYESEEDEWIRLKEKNPAIIDVRLSPISSLAEEGSSSEKFLIQALKEFSENKKQKMIERINETEENEVKNEILFYYWRQYGNNKPILFKCSQSDYYTYKDKYNGAGKSPRKWGGLYLNYNKYFTYSNIEVPGLTYCGDTYFYYYGKTTYGKMAQLINDTELNEEKLKYYLE